MALGDYLTGPEWDACFYLSFSEEHKADNFGDSMRMTIDALLKKGYEFPGLDENGNKLEQVENGINAPKIMIFFGEYHGSILEIITSGRKFVKEHLPELLIETDESFDEQIKEAEKQNLT